MKKLSRREFIIKSAAGICAATLTHLASACAPQIETSSLLPSSTQPLPIFTTTSVQPEKEPQRTPSPTASPQPPAATHTSPPAPQAGRPELVVARGGQPDQMVFKAVEALGGIDQFVARGARVVIKPNICVAYHSYEYAATTNPWVIGALVKLCKDAGATSVHVFDFPFGGSAKEAYTRSGIEAQVKANGGEMVIMSGYKYIPTAIPRGKDLKNIMIYDEILKADTIINVPVAKNHNLARYTLAMKNLMGVINDRAGMHRNLGQRLADLSTVIKPTLNVIDAVRVLVNNGPTGGNLEDVRKLDTLILSTDIVAADAYAATLFDRKPSDLAYVVAGAAMGLGKMDLDTVRIEEIKVDG